jgi:hypothetical protein
MWSTLQLCEAAQGLNGNFDAFCKFMRTNLQSGLFSFRSVHSGGGGGKGQTDLQVVTQGGMLAAFGKIAAGFQIMFPGVLGECSEDFRPCVRSVPCVCSGVLAVPN